MSGSLGAGPDNAKTKAVTGLQPADCPPSGLEQHGSVLTGLLTSRLCAAHSSHPHQAEPWDSHYALHAFPLPSEKRTESPAPSSRPWTILSKPFLLSVLFAASAHPPSWTRSGCPCSQTQLPRAYFYSSRPLCLLSPFLT